MSAMDNEKIKIKLDKAITDTWKILNRQEKLPVQFITDIFTKKVKIDTWVKRIQQIFNYFIRNIDYLYLC